MSTSPRLAQRVPVAAAAAAVAGDDLPPACGWFDSSHDLQRGLLVTEHACPDGVAHALPLGDWLAMHLNGWRAQPAALAA